MQNVTVSKSELVNVLTANRAQHIAQFADAMEGYKEQVILELKKALKIANAGKSPDFAAIYQLSAAPTSHEKDYDLKLRMLEMSTDEKITLSYNDFNQLVMDEWSWKQAFASSSLEYSKSMK